MNTASPEERRKAVPSSSIWRMLGAGAFLGLFIYSWPSLWPIGQNHLTQEFKYAQYIDTGEALLHRIPYDVSGSMPLSTLSNALIFNHAPLSSAWRVLPGFIEIVLLFAVVQLLAPAAVLPPLAALAIILNVGRTDAYRNDPVACYSLLLLLVAGMMIWRAQARSVLRSVLLALAIGSSLFYRSQLFLLPPLLVFFEHFARGRRPLRFQRELLILLIVPYLFLLPWLRMNLIARHRWIPFESEEADDNIGQAALGLVHTNYYSWKSLAARPLDGRPSETVLRWAAGEVARHPLRYAFGYVSRARYVVGLHPLLFLSGFFAFYFFRKDPGYQQLGLLSAYFVLIHCFLSLESRYFMPLWPLLAAAAAGLLRGPRSARGSFDCLEYRLSSSILQTGVALVLFFSLFTAHAVNVHADTVRRGESTAAALDEALEKSPRDAWLLFERGKLEIKEGKLPAAEADLTEACALRPMVLRRQLALAWVRALRGHPEQLFAWSNQAGLVTVNFDAHILKADFHLKTGDIQKAKKELRDSFSEQYAMRRTSYTRNWLKPNDAERAALRNIDDLKEFTDQADDVLQDRPDSERIAVRRAIDSTFNSK